jgi:hypothetical protein
MKFCQIVIIISFLLLTSCNYGIKSDENAFEGKLISFYSLVKSGEKTFPLDSLTGQKNKYSQLYFDSNGVRIFSVLNYNTKTIYFYSYETCKFLETLSITKKDSTLLKYINAYYVKNKDSIYFHDDVNQKILLLDSKKNLKDSISLIKGMNPKTINWTLKFPFYNPTASSPMHLSKQGLIYTGQYMWAIPDSLINNFKFTALVDFKKKKVSHINTYPDDIYGGGMWDDPIYSAVYSDLDFENNKLVYSYPIAHDVYVVDLSTNVQRTFFAGSNYAKSISGIRKQKKGDLTYREKLKNHIVKTDLYGGIKYDKYNKVYYRILRKGIQNAKPSDDLFDKNLAVIILDKDFNYLGEKVIGKSKEWNWENSFVTKEGLNIEYIEQSNNDETQLTFKIFKPIKK